MNINAAFKLFDIRGEYPGEVDERMAFVVGKALTLLRRPRKVLVASDTRESSPLLKNFLKDGLAEGEARVFDLYEAPVPQFYYTVATGDYDLGVIVTASHVADCENGFKIVGPDGLPFDQSEIATLKNLVLQIKNDPIVVPAIESKRINSTDEYINTITRLVGKQKFVSKVCLDVTKSAVITPVMVLFSRLGVNFSLAKSNRSGSPLLPENQEDLGKAVVENNADLGILWDSDGDRVVFLDGTGKMIPLSFVLACLARSEVAKKKGTGVVVDVRAGLVVRDLVAQAGGSIRVLPAWSQFIKFAMRENANVVFGGETSGHFIFRDFHCIDDGILAALRFLSLWEEENVSGLLTDLKKKYFELPERNFPCDLKMAPDILERLSELYRSKEYQVSVEDGLTVFGQDFKFNLRASLTEPLLRLNLETRTEKDSNIISREIEKHIEENE